jgi:hypothetical protein
MKFDSRPERDRKLARVAGAEATAGFQKIVDDGEITGTDLMPGTRMA